MALFSEFFCAVQHRGAPRQVLVRWADGLRRMLGRASRAGIAAAGTALAVAIALLYLWNLREIAGTEGDNARALTANLAAILASYAEAGVGDVAQALDRVDDLLDVTRPVRNDYPELHAIQQGMPGLSELAWTDAAGTLVGTSMGPEGAPSLSLAGSPIFAALRDRRGPEIAVALPALPGSDRAVTFARRRHDIEGQFAGLTLGVVGPAFFHTALAKVGLQSGIQVAFALRDGTLLARFPARDGRAAAEPDLTARLAAAGADGRPASFRRTGAGCCATASVALVPRTDLEVMAALDDAQAFRAWRLQLVTFGPLIAMVCALVAGAGLVLGRQFERERQRMAAVAEARAQADSANRQKSRFLAMMSHEIRTPMTGIIGFADLLMAGEADPERKRQLGFVRDAGRHLMAILNDVLDLSKIEAGAMRLEPAPFELPELLESVRAIVASAAFEKGLAVSLSELPPDLPRTVVGDAGRLRQVLLNLMGNAVKFTAEGGITLTLSVASPGRVRFSVSDTGAGIADGQRHLLFKEFSQAGPVGAQRHDGTGLGLAVSKRLVEMMGGEIGVHSRAGAGSTFWFTAWLPAAGPAEAAGEPAAAADGQRGASVLVVDDMAMNRELVRAILECGGHHVVLAGDGEAAVAAVARQPFDLVLMDVHMPVLDGLGATARIRALPGAAARVPILAMTADAMPDEMERCRQAGMDGSIAKPFGAQALLGLAAEYRRRRASGASFPPALP